MCTDEDGTSKTIVAVTLIASNCVAAILMFWLVSLHCLALPCKAGGDLQYPPVDVSIW